MWNKQTDAGCKRLRFQNLIDAPQAPSKIHTVHLVGRGMTSLVKTFMLYPKECHFEYLSGERLYRLLKF